MFKKRYLLLIIVLLISSNAVFGLNINDLNDIDNSDNISKLYYENYSVFDDFTFNSSLNISLEDKSDESLFDKQRPIYFAMDHTNADDEIIMNNIINILKNNGFNIVSAEIGPNKMSQNTLYLYENNITNAIVFHLFNGVDPSTIRELAKNGDDNRGRIVRSNGNDVVLAWFYDSADPVHENGSAYTYIRGSETGGSLKNPGEYMVENDIVGICTSSDMNNHTEDADYDGTKTAYEFMKLFKNESNTY